MPRNPSKAPARCAAAAFGLILSAVLLLVVHTTPKPSPEVITPPPSNSPTIDARARQAGADENWWQAVSANIETQEYVPSATAEGFQARNRAHNLRTSFGEDGLEIAPRTEKNTAPAWRFAWQTTGFGRPGRMKEVSPSPPSSEGARIIYERDGWSEWYENTAKGLEQGFTVERRPAGDGPLQIVGTFPVALRPEVREDGAVDFLDEHGARAIRYGELHVWDAEKQELPAELVLATNTLAIQIDDQNAAYPLIVDPLMTSPAWTAEGNGIWANFGVSVATAGDVNGDGFSDVIVGALYIPNGPNHVGAFVYHGSATGLATTPAWTAESVQEAGFGGSVASAGDVNGDGFSDVVVGAPSHDNGQVDEGKAYVYHGSATGLASSPAWTAESNQNWAALGYSVASAGDVNADGYSDIVIGAPGYDNDQFNEGRVFVFNGSSAGLALTPTSTLENNLEGSHLGTSVAGAGDVNGDGFADVVVGAPDYTNPEPSEGGAFVYHGSPAGLITGVAWTTESNQVTAYMGTAVATAGDVNGDGYSDVVIGAANYENGEQDEGRAWVFHGSATGLAASAAWIHEANQVGGVFGSAVGSAGDVNGDGYSDLIVGAPNLFDDLEFSEGWAFVFEGSATGLATSPAWTGEGELRAAAFGNAVGAAGDVNGDGFSDVIVGAYLHSNGQESEGRAYVYHGLGATLATSSVVLDDLYADLSLATAGDVNGDGFSDVIYGVRISFENREFAVVHYGRATLEYAVDWREESDQAGAGFGQSVATTGDVNGDGFSDVIVGAYLYDNGQVDEGRAYVYHGSANGPAATPAWTAESDQAGGAFGFSVAPAGDVNGDGFSDVIVGAPGYGYGRAYVYHGSANGLAATPAWTVVSDQNGFEFGFSVAPAGDVNGDGFSDVIVGDPNYSSDEGVRDGRAYVYHGSANGLAATPAWTAITGQHGADFGRSVATAGDVNGDGFSDIIVGAPGYSNGEIYEGRAYVYHGSPVGLASLPAWTAESDQEGANLGNAVSAAGDVNGDGFSDVIVGAFRHDNQRKDGGRAYVYQGSANGLAATPAWIGELDENGSNFGRTLAGAGDLNGDGFSDVVIGGYDWSFPLEWRVFAYLGNQGDGLDRIPRQARTDDSAPIWPLGNSDSDSAFRLKALGRTPAGRGNVGLQFEVKPAGVPFDGTGLVNGPVANTGAPGVGGSIVPLTELASGLPSETLYHWRLRIITDSPYAPRSRWLSLPYNAVTEADVRTGEGSTGVAEGAGSRTPNLQLGRSAPNPFTAGTQFTYTLVHGGHHRLAVYDVQGRQVALLADRVQPAGQYTGRWDGRNASGDELPSGIYFLRLDQGGQVEKQKLVIAR